MKNSVFFFLLLASALVATPTEAQHSYGDGSSALAAYPCLWPALDSVQVYLPEVFASAAGGTLLFFTVNEAGVARVADYLLFPEEPDTVQQAAFARMLERIPSIKVTDCARLQDKAWFVVPLAIYHPVWTGWHPGLPTIFRKDQSAQNALRVLLRFTPAEVLPTYFGFRENPPAGCPHPSCE